MKKLNKKSIKANRQLRPIKASYDAYTEDLSEFGMREIEELRDILTAWLDNGLPDDFWDTGVKPAFNRNSGYVFLVNEEYQVCMEVDGRLESFYTTPYSGHEGFYEDLLDEADESWKHEDLEYLRDIAESRGDTEGIDQLTALMADDGGDLDIESSTRRYGRSVMADSTRSAEASLYNRLMKAVPNPDTDVDTHESDLYVLKTPETTKILKDHYDRIGVSFQATTFKDQITHRIYYDVPFGYMNEFVEKRRRGLD